MMKRNTDLPSSALATEAPIGESQFSTRALIALAIAPAAIGMTELTPMGLLPEIAHDLRVSIPAAGMLVTWYALGVVVGAPLLAVLTARLPRKPLLLGAVALYLIGNVLCAVMPTYQQLMFVRFMTALVHGVIFGESYVMATKLAAPGKQSRALAIVFSGFTIATVMGVPIATWIGQAVGWRLPFLLVTIVGICSWLAIALLVPSVVQEQQAPRLRWQLRVLCHRGAILALLMTVLFSGSEFTLLTYITPLLEQIVGFAPVFITPLLLIFGIGSMVGNIAGGRLADWRLMPSLIGLLVFVVVALVVFLVIGHIQIAAVVILFLWESAAFAAVSPLQMRVIEQAGDASSLASILNIAAFNMGNALGAFVGGLAIETSFGLPAVPVTAAFIMLVNLCLALWSAQLDSSAQVK